MFEFVNQDASNATIKVIGVGGGGGNAVAHMIKEKVEDVEFISANTDNQVLGNTGAETTIQLGENLTKGLGAGANPSMGREAAMEDRDIIDAAIDGAEMLFITAGMGGGTGTGAAPVVAELAKEKGILTVAIVTKPFPFEGAKRMRAAEQGLVELRKHVDSLIVIPNAKILEYMGNSATIESAFGEANNVLYNAVDGISKLITCPGLINVDFADVKTVMSDMGMAMMGTATASGADRAETATQNAILSPLLEDTNLHGAGGFLVNITSGPDDMTIGEFTKVGEIMNQFASDDAEVVIGTTVDPEMSGELRVTVVATGLLGANEAAIAKVAPAQAAAEMTHSEAPVAVVAPNMVKARAQVPVRPAERVHGRTAAFVPPSRNVMDNKERMNAGTSSAQYGEYSAEEIAEMEIPAFLRKQQNN